MSDALALVKRELGRNAVILSTRTLTRGGLFGIGSRNEIEITATADRRVFALRQTAAEQSRRAAQPSSKDADIEKDSKPAEKANVASKIVGPSAPNSDSISDRPSVIDLTQPSGLDAPKRSVFDPNLHREIEEIRGMVQNLLRKTEQTHQPKLPNELVDHYSHLIGQDVARELANRLMERIAAKVNRPALNASSGARGASARNEDRIREELRTALCEMLPPASPLKLVPGKKPTVIAAVGPTGVGKTTTIAKLAANMKLRENKRVGLITIDSYRIAAVEQLKTYAQILRVPLEPVLTPAEMRTAVKRMADLDLVLIDTAGRSQKDDLRISELAEFFRACPPDEVHLVLSTTSREDAIREAVKKFKALGAGQIIFTKLDEAVGFGVILNTLQSVDMRLSYLTNGQSVPDDIELGSTTRVAQLILDGKLERPAATNVQETRRGATTLQ